MRYEEWEVRVPEAVKADSVWRVKAYRLALFLSELGWLDVAKLVHDQRTLALSDQLYRAVGSISANIAEGYSHGTGKDRARFYEYALDSARESRDWYYKGHHVLGEVVIQHRLALLEEVIRLLLTMIPHQRGHTLREDSPTYQSKALSGLLENVPLPAD